MAKQTMKQQIIQSIADSQVQQVLEQQRQQQAAQLQADFAAWQQQQMNPEELMADFNSWRDSQQTQSAPKQQIPSLKSEQPKVDLENFFKPMTASGKDVNKESADLQQQKVREREQAVKSTTPLRRGTSTEDAAASLVGYLPWEEAIKAEEEKKQQEAQNDIMIGSGINQVADLSNVKATEQDKKLVDDFAKAEKWSQPNYQLSKTERAEAQRIAREGMARLEYREIEDGNIGVRKFEEMTPEEQKQYRMYMDLDMKSDRLQAFSVGAASKAVDMAKAADDVMGYVPMLNPLQYSSSLVGMATGVDPYKIAKDSLYNEWKETAAPTEAVAQKAAPLVEDVPLVGDVSPYGAGEMAVQIGAYALTNPAFDAAGSAIGGGSKLAGFIGNQVGQNLQDLALDTIPRYNELKAQGLTDEEIRPILLQEGLLNVGGNLALGVVGEIPGLIKSGLADKAAKDAADAAFRANAEAGAEQLAKLADEGAIFKDADNVAGSLPKVADQLDTAAKSVPTESADDVVKAATEQAETAAKNIDDIAKQMPEVPEQTADIVESAVKAQQPINVPKSLTPELKQDVDGMTGYLIDMSTNLSKAAEASGDATLIKKADQLFQAVDTYVETASKSADPKAIREAGDNLRKSFNQYVYRAKQVDPSIVKDVNNMKTTSSFERLTSSLEDYYDPIRKEAEAQAAADAILEMEGIKPTTQVVENSADVSNLKVQELNGKNGTKLYQVVSENGNLTTPVEPGKVYKSKEAAEQALETLRKTPLEADSANMPSSGGLIEKGSGPEKTSKYRTNSMNKLDSVNEKNAPISDYGYKQFSVDEQRAAGIARYQNSQDAVDELLNKEAWDEVDARYAQDRWTELMEAGEAVEANKLARRMSYELREGGRLVQTAAEMDDIASQLNEARRMINSRVDKMGGVGTAEALDNFASKVEKNLGDIDLATSEGRNKAADVMAEMMGKDMKSYAPTNKAMTSKQFKKSNKIVNDIRSGKLTSVEDIINEVYKQNGNVPINAENQKKIYDLLNQAKELEDGSREQEKVLAHAAKLATQGVPTTFGEKVKGVLYMNMLGNFKTAISRNAFGNLGYQVLEQARSPVAAGVDWLTSKATGKHSTLGWNKEKFKAYGQGLKKGAKEQAGDFISGLNTGRSGQLGWAEALKNNKGTFNYNGNNNVVKGLSDLSNKAEFYVENAMKFGDRPFYEANYLQAQTELRQLIQRYGKENVAGLSAVPDELLDDTIDMISAVRAADSVFQKQGKISKGLTDLRNGLGEISQGTVGVDLLSTASSPFTLTPGNMLERAVEYSPLGALKNTVETASELRQGKFNQRRFVDEASRTLTGLPILGGAYALAKNGRINGGYSEDPDEKQAQIDDGFIEYGYNVPDYIPYYGGKTLNTSDIPVVGPFMQAGAAVAEEGLNSKSLLQAASAITAGSTMQGLRKAFGADNGFGSSSSVENLVDTFKSSGTQLIPSLLRQTAQTMDPYKRDLGEYGTNEYYLNSIKNSIPFVRQTLPVKTDVEGNPVLQNQGRSIGEKILENYLLPMNVSEYSPSPLNEEASRLLEATDSAIAFVPKAKRSELREWDEKAELGYSEEQFRNYKEELGRLNSEAGHAIIDSDFYKGLDDTQKAKVLSDAYAAMKQIAKENATGIPTDNKLAAAYKEGNIEGMLNYLAGKEAVKETGYQSNSKVGKAIQTAADNGDTEAAYTMAEQVKLLPDYGLDQKGPAAAYTKAYGVYDGLTAEEFAKTYKGMDADHNQGLKKVEVVDYMNKQSFDYEDGMEFWRAYAKTEGSSPWKVPEYKDGKWQ